MHFAASARTVSTVQPCQCPGKAKAPPGGPTAVIVGTPNTYLRGRLYVGGGVFQFLKVIVGYYVSIVILETQN